MTMIPPGPSVGPVSQSPSTRVDTLRDVSVRLEASFLAEMLKASGFAEEKGAFSGGEGADQFTSFYREAIAHRMVQAGGIGLADHIFASLVDKE